MLVQVKLDYYYKVRKNWLEREKIEFLIDLEEMIEKCKNNLEDKILFQGAKEIYSTLGDYCLKRKSYRDAIKLYRAGMHFHREQKAIVEWLEIIIRRANSDEPLGDQDQEQCQSGIRRLVSFGLVEPARSWCYRFVEVCGYDDASVFLSLLSEILATKERMHENFLGEIDISSFCNLLERPEMN